MGKIAKGVKKKNFTMLYGSYCYIIIENFPKKFSWCAYSPFLLYLSLCSQDFKIVQRWKRRSMDGFSSLREDVRKF